MGLDKVNICGILLLLAGELRIIKEVVLIWHSVITVSGIKIRYSPSTQELRCVFAKRVPIKLTELSGFYVIQVSLLSDRANLPPNPPPKFVKAPGRKISPFNPLEVAQPNFPLIDP